MAKPIRPNIKKGKSPEDRAADAAETQARLKAEMYERMNAAGTPAARKPHKSPRKDV